MADRIREQCCRSRGIVRVDLNNIFRGPQSIPEYTKNCTPTEQGQLRELLEVFRIGGCHRESSHNFIDVLVPEEALDGLYLPGIETLTLQEVLLVPLLRCRVQLLRGLKRLLAAYEFFKAYRNDEEDCWWIARVFTDDLPDADQTRIAQHSYKETKNADGLILRNIRICHQKGDGDLENEWWSRLSPKKREGFARLMADARYAEKFDRLLEWEGLWPGVRAGCLRHLISMNCHEEILEYLDRIGKTWSTILSGLDCHTDLVDEKTVQKLETLAPANSSVDKKTVEDLMKHGEIFPKLVSYAKRDIVLCNITSVEGLIPSLFTLFESYKWLEPCAEIMKKIAPVKGHGSIRNSLWSSYFRPSQMIVEYAEGDERIHPTTSLHTDRMLAYQQLWLFVLRNTYLMSKATPRKSKGPKPYATGPNERLEKRLAQLAQRLGFENDAIRRLNVSVVPVSNAITRRPQYKSFASLDKKFRCGRPHVDDDERDRGGLFLPIILEDLSARQVESVSTLFCKRDMFLSLLGDSNVGTDFLATRVASADHGTPDPQAFDSCVLEPQNALFRVPSLLASSSFGGEVDFHWDQDSDRAEGSTLDPAVANARRAALQMLEQGVPEAAASDSVRYGVPRSSSRYSQGSDAELVVTQEDSWKQQLERIDLDTAKLDSTGFVLMLFEPREYYYVQDDQVQGVVSRISQGYRYYVADRKALRDDGGFFAVSDIKQLAEAWTQRRVLAIQDDGQPAWTATRRDNLKRAREHRDDDELLPAKRPM